MARPRAILVGCIGWLGMSMCLGLRPLNEAARKLPRLPTHSESFGNHAPTANGVLLSVILSHAGTFAFKSFRIPARRGALLLFSIGLNNVNAIEPHQAKPNDFIKPSFRHLPALLYGVPNGLEPLSVLKPRLVIGAIRQVNL